MKRAGFLAALAAVLFCAVAEARGPWLVLKDCRHLADQSNDADSFHVSAGGKEYIFRLYFVDAPETDAAFPERVNEQSKYFGITPAQTLQLGGYARRFTKEKLARPFTVRTCLQDAMGRSRGGRFYAFIETSEGDLAELLVANGMARVHGTEAQPVGLSSPEREWRKLERLQREAKQQKVGAWGASSGRMTARLPRQPPTTGPDSFNAFFHPERLVPQEPADPGSVKKAPAKGQLDPNTASSEELLAIPDIGPDRASKIIAGRPFATADDLRRVKGIGPKIYEKIRPYFR